MMSHRTRYLDGCGSVVKSMKKCVRRESGVAIPGSVSIASDADKSQISFEKRCEDWPQK